MASSALLNADLTEPSRVGPFENDPAPTTAYETVEDSGLLRLRHYAPELAVAGRPPVLLVYSLFKRPFIVDLDKERSIIRTLLECGLNVYLIDWRPPGADDFQRGLDAYVNEDLARAVDCVREREGVERVSIIGICFGGLLATIYAALHADSVRHLVPVAVGIEPRHIVSPVLIEQVLLMYGNVPSWWVRNAVNARVPGPAQLPQYLAAELDEPELGELEGGQPSALCAKLERWINSDLPFAGQLARDILRDVYWDGRLIEGRLHIGGQPVALDQIRCPLLNISGARDELVPPQHTFRLAESVSSTYARNFVFPASHIGLMASRAAHEQLWPRVAMWLKLLD
jgi:polyhydroxyalkanoate synthase